MITAVVMPQMGLEVTEGTVSALLVEVGASVSQDEALIELETDKATTDVVAPRDGVLRAVAVELGETVPVGATLVYLADRVDEPLEEQPVGGTSAPAGSPRPVAAVVAAGAPGGEAAGARTTPNGRIRAAPVARRAAEQLGIALEPLDGTGPRGRITLRDVERAAAARAPGAEPQAAAATAPPTPPAGSPPQAADLVTESPSVLRRAVARRMTQSQAIPQYQLERDVDATHLLAQRAALVAATGAGAPRPGVNDLLVQAIAETAVRHPLLATAWHDRDGGDGPLLARRVRIGVGLAVATDRGLVVPVLRDVPHAGVAAIAAQRSRLVAAARAGRLELDQMSGGAITLSSLAGFGIERFSAMVNPGESAIVAAGQIADRVVPRGRTLAVVPTLALTVSFDHRVVDGAAGAEALATLAELLQGAMTWRP